ncbi:uncharacterized protein LOC109862834 isoform X2 [Pseudomyrmex gracilis]|uniref:uncharacterized protein LOC109862834 isoform X2 n=1 Tax=Pseudomyrmex gracilis TaxID=219809 RepID=UPI000994EFC1|nr:uncharacterized protein LOC109862834 isoform X2 [Pseudomyrmex gracilis]
MYTLVKFYDNVHYVCPSSDVFNTKSRGIQAKYSNGFCYPANVIAKNDDKYLLKTICSNINLNKPYIRLVSIFVSVSVSEFLKNNYQRNILTSHTMNDRLSTHDEEIANQDHSYTIDIEEDLSFVNSIKKETCDDENNQTKIDVDFKSKSFMYSENTTKVMNDRMSTHNERTNIFNQNHRYMINTEESLSCENIKRRSTKKKTCDNLKDQNEIVNSLKPENCQKNICVVTSYKDSNKMNRYCDLNANKEIIHIQNSLHKENVTSNTLVTINSDNESITTNKTDNYKCNLNSRKSTTPLASSDNDTDEDYVPTEQRFSSHKSTQSYVQNLNRSTSLVSSSDILNTNIGKSICNDEVMYVETSSTKSTKQNCCVFCNKLQSQLARHLVTIHSNELEVKKFAVLPKLHPERKKIIETIRKKGNFKFNTQAELNSGQLIVSRRPNEKTNKTAIDFIACVKCKGFFAKSAIRHHARVCLNKNFQKDRNVLIMGRQITGRLHSIANETLRKTVFPIMRDDKVTRIVRYDELLIRYANRMCIKYKESHQHDNIRARLRLLGRFLLALKNINTKVQDFQSVYHPRLYHDCISAINIVAKYDNKTQVYKTPAVAATLSTLLKYLGNILITECIKEEEENKKKLVKNFVKLLGVDIRTNNKMVKELQFAHKRHKKINLPSLDDIKKLHTHLTKQRFAAYTALKESFSYEKWVTLAEVTLTSVYVLNRRRPGEMERVEIENFKHHVKLNNNMFDDIDLYESLSMEDKRIVEKYVQFCIKGKLGQKIPVLLSSEMFDCITLLLKFRIKANVPKKNPFIFGLPGFDKNRYRYLRVCTLMRKFVRKCNISKSITLRGTKLKQHIAKHCIQLHLNDEVLGRAIGHVDKIRKKHYKQASSRDILLRYLEAVQENEQNSENESESDSGSEKGNVQENEQNSENESESDSGSEKGNTLNQNIRNTDETACNFLSNSMKCTKLTDKQPGKRKRNTSPYGKTKRVRWTEDEKHTVLQAFARHIENHTLPSLHEIQEVKKGYVSLARRSLPQIKTWLHNQQKKQRPL